MLGAKYGQMFYVTFTLDHCKAAYQIFNPDGSFLLDLIDARHPDQGQLWQSGNHVVDIVNRGSHSIGYRVKFSIRQVDRRPDNVEPRWISILAGVGGFQIVHTSV